MDNRKLEGGARARGTVPASGTSSRSRLLLDLIALCALAAATLLFAQVSGSATEAAAGQIETNGASATPAGAPVERGASGLAAKSD